MITQIIDFQECESSYKSFNLHQYRMLAQHSFSWQRMLAEFEQWEWRMVCVYNDTSDIVGCLPFCVSESNIGKVLMSSPIPASYAGVLHVEDCNTENVYECLLSTLIEYANDHHVDIVNIFSSPFREDHLFYQKYLEPTYTVKNFYQYLGGETDLERPYNSKFRNNLKRSLRIAEENSFRVQHTSSPVDELLSEWYNNVLMPRFRDISASVTPLKVYKAIANNLGKENLFEFAFVEYQGKMVGGGVFLYGWSQDIYLRATLSEYKKLGAGILLDYTMLKRASERNVNAYNFQSSPSRESSSFMYKRGWGCKEGNTYYYTKMLTNISKFIKAGKQAVSCAFPHFYTLPYFLFNER